jgi:hypothetical protein
MPSPTAVAAGLSADGTHRNAVVGSFVRGGIRRHKRSLVTVRALFQQEICNQNEIVSRPL